MADLSLTPTSYLVLGLVQMLEPCTSYDLKRLVGVSIGNFWSFPHSQLYAEPVRLAEHGLLSEEQEHHGRRRRLYRLTPQGDAALRHWLTVPPDGVGELRDLGLLKLFFGSLAATEDVVTIAEAKRDLHDGHLRALEKLHQEVAETATPEQLATMELGRRWNKVAADFWADVATNPPGRGTTDPAT
ncbi:MAG: PadR family transcriptional regulator [Acidimicrobiia bacterium]